MSERLTLTNAPDVLTVEQVAELLRISRGTAYEGVRTGEIPAVRVGRTIRVPRVRLAELLGAEVERNGGAPTGDA